MNRFDLVVVKVKVQQIGESTQSIFADVRNVVELKVKINQIGQIVKGRPANLLELVAD